MSIPTKFSRRDMLKFIGAGATVGALAACAPSAQPGAEGGEGAPSGAKKSMSIATYAIPFHDWQRYWSREWANENPDVELDVLEIAYAEMPKHQLTMTASGTLWDVVYSGVKWYPFSAVKNAFLEIDDLIANSDLDLDDFFSTAVENCKVDGKMYGLPYEMHPGNPALIAFNTDYLDENGLAHPTDDMTTLDYAELAEAATDLDAGIYGTNYLPGNYYDFANLTRSYGGNILNDEGTEFTFNTDPLSVEAARWITSLRTERQVAPNREEGEGLEFAAGTYATTTMGLYAVRSLNDTIADKFNYDFSLHPVGPDGQRGYSAFVSIFSIASSTEYPQEAFDMISYILQPEAGVWTVLNPPSYPIPRKSVWTDERVQEELHPIFQRAYAMMSDESIPGPFPMPNNVRFQELQDTWANTSPDLFYGDVSFEQGMETVQSECQEIVSLPRP